MAGCGSAISLARNTCHQWLASAKAYGASKARRSGVAEMLATKAGWPRLIKWRKYLAAKYLFQLKINIETQYQ
jgi:hypothetical protein